MTPVGLAALNKSGQASFSFQTPLISSATGSIPCA